MILKVKLASVCMCQSSYLLALKIAVKKPLQVNRPGTLEVAYFVSLLAILKQDRSNYTFHDRRGPTFFRSVCVFRSRLHDTLHRQQDRSNSCFIRGRTLRATAETQYASLPDQDVLTEDLEVCDRVIPHALAKRLCTRRHSKEANGAALGYCRRLLQR